MKETPLYILGIVSNLIWLKYRMFDWEWKVVGLEMEDSAQL